jgi:hypothetical protein
LGASFIPSCIFFMYNLGLTLSILLAGLIGHIAEDDTRATIRQAYNYNRLAIKSDGLLFNWNQSLLLLITQKYTSSKGVFMMATPFHIVKMLCAIIPFSSFGLAA